LTCYDLLVPENRSESAGRVLRLPVLVFRAEERDRRADPVVLVGGGPGAVSYTEPQHAEMWRDKFKTLPWLKGRDLIVYDQRGVGGARPSLECPEIDATRVAPLDVAQIRAAMSACRDRLLRENIDLGRYDTKANADDLDALRRSLRLASAPRFAAPCNCCSPHASSSRIAGPNTPIFRQNSLGSWSGSAQIPFPLPAIPRRCCRLRPLS
jgi:hypothetical protein